MRFLALKDVIERANNNKQIYLVDLDFQGSPTVFPFADYYFAKFEEGFSSKYMDMFKVTNSKCSGIYYLAKDYGKEWIAFASKDSYNRFVSGLKMVGLRGFIGATIRKSVSGVDFEFAFDGYRVAKASLLLLPQGNYLLHDFVVEDRFRNMGFGTKILSYLVTTYKVDTLNVAKDNLIAQRLYEKFGFAKNGIEVLCDGKVILDRMVRVV